ncbi:hypothetical protein DIPPA_04210 [Diplonema papillatum]|nr:hypothetical protein DIPPA_04210 [Diplonema papillatum]
MRVSSLLLCIALAGSGHALLLDRVAALETTVASQLTMLLDLQSRLTALEQTMGAEKQTTEVLHGTVAALVAADDRLRAPDRRARAVAGPFPRCCCVIALAGSGHALLLDGVAALETTVASQLTMLLDLQSRLTALEQTMGAEKQTTEVLHSTVSALGRQMIAFEHRTAERVRSQGQSGGKQSSGGLWELKALREGKCRCP